MKNTLELNFASRDKVQACLEALSQVSPVSFMVSEPQEPAEIVEEYLDIAVQVILSFRSEADRNAFMRDQECRSVYDRHAR